MHENTQNAQLGTEKRGGMTKLVIVLVMSVNYGKSGKKKVKHLVAKRKAGRIVY